MRAEAESTFRLERNKMLGFIRKNIGYGSSVEAEDILQDVALGVFSGPEIERPVNNMISYIYTAIRNRIVDIYRGSKKDKNTVSLDETEYLAEVLDDPDFDTDDLLERMEIQYRIFEALRSLKPEQCEIWIATEIEGRKLSDIARENNIPVGTLLARKHRAVRELRRLLSDYYEKITK